MVIHEKSPVGGPKITVIGGGTGNFTVLSGLKPLVGEGLTAVVNMADDGGSTGELRDRHGVLPAGDARQCLVALSNESDEMRALFNTRFSETDGFGPTPHNFGNLLFLAAERATGSYKGALDLAGRILNITGKVVPVTHDNRRLVITTTDGNVIYGEHSAEKTHVPSLQGANVAFDKNPTQISPEAEASIKESDLTVIAPGDLYTSIAPALAVRGMYEALSSTRVLMVTNIMNRPRHTFGFDAATHAAEVERIVGGPVLNYLLTNSEEPSQDDIRRYEEEEGEILVPVIKENFSPHYKVFTRHLLSNETIEKNPNDKLANTRSLVRHSPAKVGRGIMTVLYTNGD